MGTVSISMVMADVGAVEKDGVFVPYGDRVYLNLLEVNCSTIP